MQITICDDQERDRVRITDILTNIATELQENFTILEFDNPSAYWILLNNPYQIPFYWILICRMGMVLPLQIQ